jgi:hypothetical protein
LGVIAAAAAALMLFAASAQAQTDASGGEFDWQGLGGCTVPVVGMPVDFDNVERFIPESEHAKVITIGAGGQRLAGLIFVTIRCPHNHLLPSGEQRNDVSQAMVGVLYQSLGVHDLDKAQFYLLSSATNWHSFTQAERGLGLPSDNVPDAILDVTRDPVTGLGTWRADVPGGRAPFAATGEILAPDPIRELPQDAVHYFTGPQGRVRVHHDESWAPGNEAVGTITAPAGSLVARWMGSTVAQAEGLYVWIHDHLHVHRYRFVP